ncbi:MAG TPA: DUF2182 domain-containing protein, partial [Paracoccaceae bacterium]|nr:DUF2182 domain-containing protein [Paracoccaceae bacterium]
DMDGMTGTMGLDLPAWLAMWTLMMAAMMLPSTAPFASMYARTVQQRRGRRLALFAGGYLLVWVASGLPAFGLAWLAGQFTGETAGTVLAAAIFVAAGLYQLTPLKERCLAHCRTPVSHIFHYVSFTGPLRDLRAGLGHGMYCLGCCWGLMLLLAAFGIMNLWAMLGLAVVIAVEKLLPWGRIAPRAFGSAALIAAVAVFWVPSLAPGLTNEPMTMDSGAMQEMEPAGDGGAMQQDGAMPGEGTEQSMEDMDDEGMGR